MTALIDHAQQVWDIPGGIHPAEHKELSNQLPIQPAPLPARLILPLSQHLGAPAEPCVSVGERVLKGQLLAAANGLVSVPVHAPTSGTISAIGPQPFPMFRACRHRPSCSTATAWSSGPPCSPARTIATWKPRSCWKNSPGRHQRPRQR